MFALGLFSYQRQGLVNKDIAFKWWDLYLKTEMDQNPSFVAIIESSRREFNDVKKKLKELVEHNDSYSN